VDLKNLETIQSFSFSLGATIPPPPPPLTDEENEKLKQEMIGKLLLALYDLSTLFQPNSKNLVMCVYDHLACQRITFEWNNNRMAVIRYQ
jgi:hypothetical protein